MSLILAKLREEVDDPEARRLIDLLQKRLAEIDPTKKRMEITAEQLKRSMPGVTPDRVALYLAPLNAAMAEFEINTTMRAAAFLAQVGHESGSLRWMQEIWGPTPAQKRYERDFNHAWPPNALDAVNRLAFELGNSEKGDGVLFKGHGPIQITGRTNHSKYGEAVGVDLIARPEMAASKDVAFRIAGSFWKTRGLNELADAGDFMTITRRINGGLNGLEDRKARYAQAKVALN